MELRDPVTATAATRVRPPRQLRTEIERFYVSIEYLLLGSIPSGIKVGPRTKHSFPVIYAYSTRRTTLQPDSRAHAHMMTSR